MATRKAISKRVRFEVFKRDSFKCQYCGKSAPEVILHVDHLSPVSKGGKNDILNLITACLDCNAGKGGVELHDDAAIKKQKAQLDELNVKREQLEMLLKWRKGLESINDQSVEAIAAAWGKAVPGWFLNETGLQKARALLKKHGLDAVLNAIEVSRTSYVKFVDGKPTKESCEIAWHKVGGILRMQSVPEWKRELYYIRGILRNRMEAKPYFEHTVIRDMEAAVLAGLDTEFIKRLALEARYWSEFNRWLEESVKEIQGDGQSQKH